MAAKQLLLPANRALNSDALPVPGAVAYLYETGSDTPAEFYSDEALTVSLGSSITANAAGWFTPVPYQDADTPFRLRLEDADGGELADIDPFYFGVIQGLDGAPATISVGTVTTLAAGASATVANVGTGASAVLNFGIPQGTAGTPAATTLTGDVTGSGSGSFAATIGANKVTYGKMQQSSAASVLVGRGAGSGAGNLQEITLGSGLSLAGTVLSAVTSGGATLANGDYGDITVTVGGTVMTIDPNVVTFAKMQDITTDRLIGRDTASTGDPEEISVGGGLEFTGSAGIQRSALTGDVTASAGSNTTALAANAVTDAKLRQSAGLSVVGRSANSTGNVADITAANDGEVLRRNGTAIGFGTVDLATGVSGNLSTSRLNGGTSASSSTFWRGDGTWAGVSLGTSVTFAASGGATAGATYDGSTAKTIDYSTVGAAPSFLKIASASVNTTLTDASHNNGLLTMTGTTNRTITLNSTPTAGFSCIIHNLASASMTISCAGGVYKNGGTTSPTSGTIPQGGVVTVVHKGSGVWFATGDI